MADDTWSDLFKQATDIGVSLYKGITADKAAKKAAKAMSGVGQYYGGGGYGPMPYGGRGMGWRGGPGFPGGMSYGYSGPPSSSPGIGSSIAEGLGIPEGVINYFGGSTAPTRRSVSYECYTTPSGRSAVSGWRSLGHPLLWSGDMAAVKRVARVRRKLGVHRRPR